jgi:hypothetical protein
MKMGTIASLRRYDVAAAEAIRPDNLRRTAILRYASWAAVFRMSRVARLPFDGSSHFDQSRVRPMGHSRHRNRIIAIAQLDLDHGDCHWAVAKWAIGIGQPLWRRAMMAAGRRPDAGVPQRPRPASDAHASLLKLPPPSNYFLCRDPGAGFAPSCLGECAIAARHEPEHRTMWYRKNVGGWERAARLIGGGLMLICGVVALHASPLGLLLSGTGVVTLVTGVFGYCPACAIAGREPLKG